MGSHGIPTPTDPTTPCLTAKGGWDGEVVQMQSFDFVPYLPDFVNDVDERGMPVCPAPVASEVEASLLAWSRIDPGR